MSQQLITKKKTFRKPASPNHLLHQLVKLDKRITIQKIKAVSECEFGIYKPIVINGWGVFLDGNQYKPCRKLSEAIWQAERLNKELEKLNSVIMTNPDSEHPDNK